MSKGCAWWWLEGFLFFRGILVLVSFSIRKCLSEEIRMKGSGNSSVWVDTDRLSLPRLTSSYLFGLVKRVEMIFCSVERVKVFFHSHSCNEMRRSNSSRHSRISKRNKLSVTLVRFLHIHEPLADASLAIAVANVFLMYPGERSLLIFSA